MRIDRHKSSPAEKAQSSLPRVQCQKCSQKPFNGDVWVRFVGQGYGDDDGDGDGDDADDDADDADDADGDIVASRSI